MLEELARKERGFRIFKHPCVEVQGEAGMAWPISRLDTLGLVVLSWGNSRSI